MLISCGIEHNQFNSPSKESSTLTAPSDSNSFYFPLKRVHRDKKNREQNLDSVTNRWYSEILFALHEPTLQNYSGPLELYRFTYIPSIYDFPVTITLGQNDGKFRMVVKACKYEGEYRPGTMIVDTSFTIGSKDWDSFIDLLNKADFWSLQAETNDRGDDGSEWILEGTKNGNYHFTTRWSPREDKHAEYRLCCDYLRDLARKSVNFHHQF
jgi:hypothetical protein